MSTIAQGRKALDKVDSCKIQPRYATERIAQGETMLFVASEYRIFYCETCFRYHIEWFRPVNERRRVDYSGLKFL